MAKRDIEMYCISDQDTDLVYGNLYKGELYGSYFLVNGNRYSSNRFSITETPQEQPLYLKRKPIEETRIDKIKRYALHAKACGSQEFFVDLILEDIL
jgi:hypothetical protein